MNSPSSSKIARRVTGLVFFAVMLSVVSVTSFFIVTQIRSQLEMRKASMDATAQVFASAVSDALVAGDVAAVRQVLTALARIPRTSYAAVTGPGGEPVAALGNAILLNPASMPAEPGLLDMLRSGTFPVSARIIKAGLPVGNLVVIADVSDVIDGLYASIFTTLIAALVASLIAIVLAIRLQRRITGPILSLISAIRKIRERRDYTTVVEHKSDDETGELVEAFNGMMAEVGSRDAALERMAYFDLLTGLGNRRYFHKHLDAALAEQAGTAGSSGLALFYFDLDGFKAVNDTLGHALGDALLINIAAILRQECQDGMQLARLGGDEFALTATGIATEAEAITLIGRVTAGLLRPFYLLQHEISITATIGCALAPRDGTAGDKLLRHADLALHSAKQEGRGRIHFYRDDMSRDIEEFTSLANDLRKAVLQDELEPFFQPQTDLTTGEVLGFESLLRWKHPSRGYVPPARFIPIAETTGQIPALGKWMLKASCEQMVAWIAAGHAPRQMSVNVSVAQLSGHGFLEEVRQILDETGLPPPLLCLELTESLFAGKNPGHYQKLLRGLKDLGLTLALDDFGTGYSSLSYLQLFPIDKVKIDRFFVTDVDTDTEKRKLTEGIVRLSHALGLTVCAEGAETFGEVAALIAMRADQVQGYALGRPEPAGIAIKATSTAMRDWQKNLASSAARQRA